jgi:prepilin peptidase CpaA
MRHGALFSFAMSSLEFIPGLATAAAVSAAISDVYARRIPNWLTYSAMIGGSVLQFWLHGWRGLMTSIGGGFLFGGVFLLSYLVGAMGAGDVKLAAALGSIVGFSASFQLMVATAFAGGGMAIIFMILSGRILETVRNTLWVLAFHLQHGLQTHPVVNLDNPGSLRMPYGLAFAAGTAYWALFMWLRRA